MSSDFSVEAGGDFDKSFGLGENYKFSCSNLLVKNDYEEHRQGGERVM